LDYLKKIYNEQTKPIVKLVNDEYILNSKYKIGTIILINNDAILNLTNNSSQKIYIDHNNLNGAYNHDIVLVQVIFNPKGRTKAKVIQILERSNHSILCYVKDYNLYTVKENAFIDCETVNNRDGDVVLFEDGKIVKVFGNISDASIDEKISLYLYNEFYRLEPMESLEFNTLDNSNRVDLTNLDFCTIDPNSAKDYDDAIYYDEKNKELYVAIADVSAYVQEGSLLDQEAYKRSFTVYLPNKMLPMLPFELSTDLCSLVPNEIRPAYVFKMKLDIKNQKVLNSSVFEALIESKNRYTYEYIDEVIEENNPNNPITNLYELTKKFRNKRLKNGYDFRSEEIRLILDKEEKITDFKVETSSPSHSLVEECMLLTNQEAAKKLKLMGIFRVHDEPSASKIKKLLDDVNALGIKAQLKDDIHSTIVSIQQKASNVGLENEVDDLIIQAQQQASYSSIKREHFGLGFKDYSHFTSPIRRYADLVLHRILKTNIVPQNIEEICEYVSTKEREIATLVWDYEDRKYARYLSNHINKTFQATLVDTEHSIATLDVEVKGARVFIDNYAGEKLFSKIDVKIISSDIISKKIFGTIQ
jgi:ribonuclease R